MDTVTYPQPSVASFITEHFVPVRLILNRPQDQIYFRAQRVIWTPTIVIADRRGVGHYQSPGYLPPELFLSMLRIGLARAQIAWQLKKRDAQDEELHWGCNTVAPDPRGRVEHREAALKKKKTAKP